MLTEGQSYLVAAFFQALLYGIYLVTLIQCFRWLIFSDEGWKPREKINVLMTSATAFIFAASTINLVTTLIYEFSAYLRRDENWNMYAIVVTQDISGLLVVMLIDLVLIYRCWIVYSKSWLIICVPFAFWFASLACSIIFGYYYQLLTEKYSLQDTQIAERALIGIYACNITTTVYTTTAIIWRILSTRKTRGGNPKRLNYVIRILAESGILYTAAVIFGLIGISLSAWGNPSWVDVLISFISVSVTFSMAGITFNMILIRVYQGRAESASGKQSLSETQSSNTQMVMSAELEEISTNTLGEGIDGIQERRRNRHEN